MTNDEPTPAAAFNASHPASQVELAYAGTKSFLKAPRRGVGELADMDVGVIGAPFDGAVSNRPGARYGPDAIRRATGWVAYLSGYKGGLTNMETGANVDYSDLAIADCGDVPIFPMDVAMTGRSIRAHVATVASQAFPILLGGDHSCTYPSFCGFAEGAGLESVGLVQIDAHSDTVSESALFGREFHGSSTHRIAQSEFGAYRNISQVAIRGYESPEFFAFAEDEGLHLYTMQDVAARGVRPVVEEAVEEAAAGTDAVYVTFDIDSVEPGIAPGTGTPEPGGLTARQSLAIAEVLGAHPAVGAFDLMEVAPNFDPGEATQRLAARILVTVIERRFLA